MAPEDERKSIWAAVGLNSDRITALEAIVKDRDESMREMIREAVRDALPIRLPTEKQLQYLDSAIERQAQKAALSRKILESAAIWAVPLLILAALKVFYEYMIAHGMWRP